MNPLIFPAIPLPEEWYEDENETPVADETPEAIEEYSRRLAAMMPRSPCTNTSWDHYEGRWDGTY